MTSWNDTIRRKSWNDTIRKKGKQDFCFRIMMDKLYLVDLVVYYLYERGIVDYLVVSNKFTEEEEGTR